MSELLPEQDGTKEVCLCSCNAVDLERTMSKRRDPRFPEVIPEDVTVSDIDLDIEDFFVGGTKLTHWRTNELASRAERAAGRPSLTAPGRHSPALNLRVSESMKTRLEETAAAQNRRQSDVVRDALEEYLAAC